MRSGAPVGCRPTSGIRLFVWHLMQHGTGDAHVPMARFYLFGRVQDYSYALPDPQAIVSRRHHLRIWKTDYTENGTPIWVGSATHDVAIEIAKNGRLINHRIDPKVDDERDFIGGDLTQTASVSSQEYVNGVSPVFEASTASGEAYHSDSRILLLDLQEPAGRDCGEARAVSAHGARDFDAVTSATSQFSDQPDGSALNFVPSFRHEVRHIRLSCGSACILPATFAWPCRPPRLVRNC